MPTTPILAPPRPQPIEPRGPGYPRWLLGAARQARTAGDRLLHPLLRGTAHRRLQRLAADGPILFVCFGNICRSPFAAELARGRMVGRRVESAGFAEPGRPAPAEAIAAARRWGVDLSNHVSRQLNARTVAAAALIVVMEPVQGRMLRSRFPIRPDSVLVLGDLDPLRIPRRLIVDPWGKSEMEFVTCYARVRRCVDAFLSQTTAVIAS